MKLILVHMHEGCVLTVVHTCCNAGVHWSALHLYVTTACCLFHWLSPASATLLAEVHTPMNQETLRGKRTKCLARTFLQAQAVLICTVAT